MTIPTYQRDGASEKSETPGTGVQRKLKLTIVGLNFRRNRPNCPNADFCLSACHGSTTSLVQQRIASNTVSSTLLSTDLAGPGYEWLTVWANGFAGNILGIDNTQSALLPFVPLPRARRHRVGSRGNGFSRSASSQARGIGGAARRFAANLER